MRQRIAPATITLLAIAALLAAGPAAAQAPDSATIALAHDLLDAMRAGEGAIEGMERMIPAQKAANPRIPEVFWSEFIARARQNVSQFVDRVAPIYAARFSRRELEQLIAFYRSPIGRRMAGEQAAIGSEVLLAAQGWGAEIGAEVAKDLSARGVLLQ